MLALFWSANGQPLENVVRLQLTNQTNYVWNDIILISNNIQKVQQINLIQVLLTCFFSRAFNLMCILVDGVG